MLSETVRVKVRFCEVDSVQMVWHGNYVKYMEDAREEFCRHWGLSYRLIFDSGYYAPVYDMHVRYDRMASVDDILVIKVIYRPSLGAKLCFDYEIRRESDGALVATASTIQLFTTRDGVFEPSEPDFFHEWKRKIAKEEAYDGK